MSLSLIRFDRASIHDVPQPDWQEEVGNYCLSPLHIFFGKVVVIKDDTFEDHPYQSTTKIIVGIIATIIFPITLAAAGIGFVALSFSASYQKVHEKYEKSLKEEKPAEKVEKQAEKEMKEEKATEVVPAGPGHDVKKLVDETKTPLNMEEKWNKVKPKIGEKMKELPPYVEGQIRTTDSRTPLDHLGIDVVANVQHSSIKFVPKKIREVIDLAKVLDEQIQKLSGDTCRLIVGPTISEEEYQPFRFDIDKWENLAISHTDKSLEKLIEECRLDLVEALAEYNINAKYNLGELQSDPDGTASIDVEGTKLIDQLVVPPTINENAVTDELRKILEDAKGTLKGDLILINFGGYHSEEDKIFRRRFLSTIDGHALGPLVQFWMMNGECDNWIDHSYPRLKNLPKKFNRVNIMHVDSLIGKREGERLVIPHDDGQLIFRCNQKHRNRQSSFEERLVYFVCRHDFHKTNAAIIEARNIALKKMTEAYGEDFVKPILLKALAVREKVNQDLNKVN